METKLGPLLLQGWKPCSLAFNRILLTLTKTMKWQVLKSHCWSHLVLAVMRKQSEHGREIFFVPKCLRWFLGSSEFQETGKLYNTFLPHFYDRCLQNHDVSTHNFVKRFLLSRLSADVACVLKSTFGSFNGWIDAFEMTLSIVAKFSSSRHSSNISVLSSTSENSASAHASQLLMISFQRPHNSVSICTIWYSLTPLERASAERLFATLLMDGTGIKRTKRSRTIRCANFFLESGVSINPFRRRK